MTRESTPPLWRQVLVDLEQRIESGDISERFPTDRELVDRYGVSRHTVREAVRRLRARGLIERHRGRGGVVRDRQVRQPAGTLYSLFQVVEATGVEQRSDVLAFGQGVFPDAAGELDLAEDQPLVHLERLRWAGDDPLALDTVWLPAEIAAPILGVDMGRTALYLELERRCGVTLDAVEEVIEPVTPSGPLRETLDMSDEEGLFRLERHGYVGDRPVEWRVTLIRGTRFAFVSTWRRAETSAPLRFGARP